VKGRVAALSFIFTTCTTICPLIGANLGRLQTELGQSLGEDISLISVSVDPATDTPQRMKAWGAQFGAKPGWSLLISYPSFGFPGFAFPFPTLQSVLETA